MFLPRKTALAEKSEPAGFLDIPEQESSLFEEPVVLIEPMQEDAGEETCSEPEEAPPSLRSALIRDVFLLFGVIYLVAWPDLRKRWELNNSPESRV